MANVKLVVAAVAATFVTSLAPDARAQSIEAETLFREGRKLIKEGKLAEGCDKLADSDRIEASSGTELNLGDCREKLGQIATAWEVFLKAAASAKKEGRDDRVKEAKKRASDLEKKLSYLTISVPESSKVEGLTIMRDGKTVDPAVWNTGVPVDPGTHEITGQAPGHEPWSTKVEITGDSAKQVVEVPRFKSIEDLVPKGGGDEPPPGGDGDKRPPDELPDEPAVHRDDGKPGMFTPMRYAAIGVGVLGLAGISGSIVFGLKAKDLQGQADDLCPQAACNDPTAIALNEDAQSAALKSNIFLGVGIAGVAGAVALWFLGAPDDAPPADDDVSVIPVLGGDGVGFVVDGRF